MADIDNRAEPCPYCGHDIFVYHGGDPNYKDSGHKIPPCCWAIGAEEERVEVAPGQFIRRTEYDEMCDCMGDYGDDD